MSESQVPHILATQSWRAVGTVAGLALVEFASWNAGGGLSSKPLLAASFLKREETESQVRSRRLSADKVRSAEVHRNGGLSYPFRRTLTSKPIGDPPSSIDDLYIVQYEYSLEAALLPFASDRIHRNMTLPSGNPVPRHVWPSTPSQERQWFGARCWTIACAAPSWTMGPKTSDKSAFERHAKRWIRSCPGISHLLLAPLWSSNPRTAPSQGMGRTCIGQSAET